MNDTILTSDNGICVSQTTTSIDTSWVTDEMMERWSREAVEHIAQRQQREAEEAQQAELDLIADKR